MLCIYPMPLRKRKPILHPNQTSPKTDVVNQGVTIGARSIIAAGSVVTKNVPADEIWGGNPAQFIKKINI